MNGQRFSIWGPVCLTAGIAVMVIGLLDAGMFLTWGTTGTLSQALADSVNVTGSLLLIVTGIAFTGGMLVTHFTNFRMDKTAVLQLHARIRELEDQLDQVRNPIKQPSGTDSWK